MKAPFVVTPQLTAVTVAYRNSRLIADEVLPRVPVALQAFKYNKYPIGEFFSPPETKVGRKGQPNQVEFSATEVTDATVDHALDDAVPQADIENAKQPGMPDPLMRATLGTTELLALAREKRAADLVFDSNQYGTNNKLTLSGTSQWSDYTNSDPVGAIMTAFDSMVMRPTIGVLGRAVFTKLAQHPKVCKAIFGNNTDAGIVTRQQLAQLLELEDLLVGEGWINTAKKGQPVSMARVWGKHAAFLHRNRNASPDGGIVTFGFTAQWGGRVAGSWEDKNIGMRGGQMVRTGESVKELVTANDLGYMFVNAVP